MGPQAARGSVERAKAHLRLADRRSSTNRRKARNWSVDYARRRCGRRPRGRGFDSRRLHRHRPRRRLPLEARRPAFFCGTV